MGYGLGPGDVPAWTFCISPATLVSLPLLVCFAVEGTGLERRASPWRPAACSLFGEPVVTTKFKVGDQVTWNSEVGHVRGKIIRVHTKNVDYKGYTHHASTADPQYEIKSDMTDHIAMHKGSALKKAND